eukprot:3365298-Rhodomonas_salina.2
MGRIRQGECYPLLSKARSVPLSTTYITGNTRRDVRRAHRKAHAKLLTVIIARLDDLALLQEHLLTSGIIVFVSTENAQDPPEESLFPQVLRDSCLATLSVFGDRS